MARIRIKVGLVEFLFDVNSNRCMFVISKFI